MVWDFVSMPTTVHQQTNNKSLCFLMLHFKKTKRTHTPPTLQKKKTACQGLGLNHRPWHFYRTKKKHSELGFGRSNFRGRDDSRRMFFQGWNSSKLPYMHVNMYTYKYVYIYICIYIHIHTHVRIKSDPPKKKKKVPFNDFVNFAPFRLANQSKRPNRNLL